MAEEANDRGHGLLRMLVLKTNPYFPFRYTNRWPYYLALKRTVAMVRPYAEVRALYLHHGVASGAWVPGLSDIDLFVIVERGLPAAREFDIVDSLRANYRRLKRWFPMLGELRILSADDLNPWLRATSEGPTPRSWMLLYGTPVLDLAFDHSPNWRTRALRLALWVYLDELPPCLAKPDSYLRRADVLRRLKKIDHVLLPIRAEHGANEAPFDPHASVPLLVAHAAKLLETAVTLVEGRACTEKREPLVPPDGNTVVRSAVVYRNSLIVKLQNGLSPDTIAAITAGGKWDRPRLPMAENVFSYVARRYDPYGYAALLRSPAMALGTDPLEGVPPPGKAEFAGYLLSHLDYVMAFTRGPQLFPASESTVVGELERVLNFLMGIRLLVEKGGVAADWREMVAQWRHEFPECARALEGIKFAATGTPRAAHQEAFALLRSLANEVRDAVTATETRA